MSEHFVAGGMRALVAAACVALLTLAGPAQAQSEAVEIVGSGVSVVPPEGFEPSDQFIGFEHPESGANFVLTTMEAAAFAELQPAFSSVEAANEIFQPQGVELTEAFSVAGADGPIPYLRGKQQVEDIELGKWLGLAGGAQTVLVTGNVPPGAEFSQAAFEAILTSLVIAAPVDINEQLAALPYALTPVAPFAVAQVMDGNMVALVETGLPEGAAQPAIIVDAQLNIEGLPPLAEAAEELLRAISDFAGIEIDRSEAAPFAGGEGWLLSGIAEDPSLGTVRVMQWLGQRDNDLIRLVAYAPVERFEELQDAVTAIAAGMQWR